MNLRTIWSSIADALGVVVQGSVVGFAYGPFSPGEKKRMRAGFRLNGRASYAFGALPLAPALSPGRGGTAFGTWSDGVFVLEGVQR